MINLNRKGELRKGIFFFPSKTCFHQRTVLGAGGVGWTERHLCVTSEFGGGSVPERGQSKSLRIFSVCSNDPRDHTASCAVRAFIQGARAEAPSLGTLPLGGRSSAI